MPWSTFQEHALDYLHDIVTIIHIFFEAAME